MTGSSRKKEAKRKRAAEDGRRQTGAALSEAADQESGVAAVAACRAAEPTSDRSFTACRTK
jgi:hypothetical protein